MAGCDTMWLHTIKYRSQSAAGLKAGSHGDEIGYETLNQPAANASFCSGDDVELPQLL